MLLYKILVSNDKRKKQILFLVHPVIYTWGGSLLTNLSMMKILALLIFGVGLGDYVLWQSEETHLYVYAEVVIEARE